MEEMRLLSQLTSCSLVFSCGESSGKSWFLVVLVLRGLVGSEDGPTPANHRSRKGKVGNTRTEIEAV